MLPILGWRGVESHGETRATHQRQGRPTNFKRVKRLQTTAIHERGRHLLHIIERPAHTVRCRTHGAIQSLAPSWASKAVAACRIWSCLERARKLWASCMVHTCRRLPGQTIPAAQCQQQMGTPYGVYICQYASSKGGATMPSNGDGGRG